MTAKEIKRISEGLPPWESMSFACGAWLQFYLFGVGKALIDSGYQKDVRYLGCSAGALTACGVVLEGNFDDAIQFCKDYCVPRAYQDFSGLFQLSDYVSRCLQLHMLDKFDKEKLKKQLSVSVTRLPYFLPEKVSNFDDKAELVSYLLASSAAFPFADLKKIKGNWYIDGGLSDFLPIEDENTITVSPFYFSESDIKPSRYVPLWWTFMPPRSKETIDWLYQLGINDCLKYLEARGLPLDEEKIKHLRKAQESHPYNKRRQVSMQRFLGYDMSHRYLSFVLDFFLLVLLVCVWKPLALLLIYGELFCRLLLLSTFSLLQSVTELYPSTLLLKPYYLVMSRLMGTVFLQGVNQLASKKKRAKMVRELWECFTCVWSLSLLLRFISGRPSQVELRKHKRLAKFSVIYRVFMHII